MTSREARSEKRLQQRYAAEKRFKFYGMAAVFFGVFSLFFLFGSIFSSGVTAFQKTVGDFDVFFDPAVLSLSAESGEAEIEEANFYGLLKRVAYADFPEVTARQEKRKLAALLSKGNQYLLRDLLIENPALLARTKTIRLAMASDIDQLHKGNVSRELPAEQRRVSDLQLQWYDAWVAKGKIQTVFNWTFLTRGDSRSAELAGIGGAIVGSVITLLVCLVLSFPMGVAAAVYLEEFAPKNRWTEFIEVNINNLAAVPSIIFGLLGLAIILNFFGVPRSTPLAGGIVLSLMTLPTIIIACRAALKAVPPSIRQGALAMGASEVQVVLHHVLPLALPATMTGAIIGLSRALGETAPLLMIGMVAFIVDIPKGVFDAAAVLPVQIYLWAESAERGFVEKTSAAIMVVLLFLVCMNSVAIYLRQRYERKW